MNRMISLVAAASLVAGGFSLIGCESTNATPQQQAEDSGSTAGGNGAFGTSPARPGSYLGDQYNSPATPPTTQPVGGAQQ